MTDEILFENNQGVATITFNRPQARNAVTPQMVAPWTEYINSIADDDEVRCVLMTGAGDHFMAGGDVKGFGETSKLSSTERRVQFEKRANDVTPLLMAMQNCPKPIIASIRGAVAGAGMGFAALADLAIASENAVFTLAHIKIGITPDGGTSYILPRLVGQKRAMEIALLGDIFDAKAALDMGVVNRVVPDKELEATTEKIAQRLASGPTVAIGKAKKLINESFNHSLPEQLLLEARSVSECTATDDFLEGIAAFAEKRKPNYRGR